MDSSHDFADLRSASRANQRARKHLRESYEDYQSRVHRPRKRRSNHNRPTSAAARGRKADAHLTIAHYTREMERMFGRLDVQRDEAYMESITYDEWEGGNWSELCLQQGATWEDISGWEPYAEVGETFSAWAQRRISEMRQVKEERLRAKLAGVAPMEWTTLPTAPGDLDGHARLDRILRRPWRHVVYDSSWIETYEWFGEYEWYWHRNMTGCFDLRSSSWHSQTYLPCYCEEYAMWGNWSPEDRMQPYALGEFFSRENVPKVVRRKVDEMCDDIAAMQATVTGAQTLVDAAHAEVAKVHKGVYEEDIGKERDMEDVCARMAEVAQNTKETPRELRQLHETYNAVYEGFKAVALVDDEFQSEEAGGRLVDGDWEVISLPALSPISSVSSSWSVVGPEQG